MKKTGSGHWGSVARIAGGLVAGLLAVRASAAQKVWTGGGADDYLSTPANWEDGVAPASGDILVFRGNVRTTPVNDYDPETTVFETLVFSNTCETAELSAPFTLSGNKIVLTGGTTFIEPRGTASCCAIFTADAKTVIEEVLDLEIELPQNANGQSRFGGFGIFNHNLLFKRTVTSGNGGPLRASSQMRGYLTFEGPIRGFSGVTRANGNGQIWLRSAENVFTVAEPVGALREGILKVDSVAAAGGAGIKLELGQAEYETPGKFIVNAAEDTCFTGDVSVSGPNYRSGAGQFFNNVAGTTATFTGDFSFTKASSSYGNCDGLGTGLLVGGVGNGVLSGRIQTDFAWLYKEGAGTWTLAGSSCATGAVTVREGTLFVNGDYGTAQRSQVKAGATLGGSGKLGDVTFVTGARFAVNLDGGTPLHVASLDLEGVVTLVRLDAALLEPGSYTLMTYGAKTGGGYFATEAGWPSGTTVTLGETAATLTVSARSLPWAGTVSGMWDFSTANWTEEGVVFKDGDAVSFGETAERTDVEVTETVRPGSILVSGARDYTFSGAGLAGVGGLEKTGTGVLTLANTNTYMGDTFVNGGVLVLAGSLAGTTVRVGPEGALTNLPTGRLTGPGMLWINGTAQLDGTNDFTGGLHVEGAVTVCNPRALGDGDVFVSNTSEPLFFSGQGGEAGRGHTLYIDNTAERDQYSLRSSGVTVTWLGDVSIRGTRLYMRPTYGGRLVFGEPGCTTTVRGDNAGNPMACGIYVRDNGAVDWYSRLDIPQATYSQTDSNETRFFAPGNRWRELSACVGVIRCYAKDTLAPAPVKLGQTYNNMPFNPVLDLNGFDQTITALVLAESDDVSSQTVQSATPATLTVSNDVATTTVRMQGRIKGAVTLRKDGVGTWTFGAQNLSTGNVAVVAGTLALTADDTLPVGELSTLEIASGAKVVLADGVSASIPYLTCGGIPFAPGVYCGEGGASGRRLDRFFGPGGGTLTVTRGAGGLTLIFR